MENNIPVYKIVIDPNDEVSGVFAVSMVSDPAFQTAFIALSKENIDEVKLKSDDVKQVLTGALIIPNVNIIRKSPTGELFYINFSEDVIWEINKKMHKLKLTDQTTLEHKEELDGNYIVESWIVEDPKNDKSNALGLGEFKKGTLMLSVYVPDTNLYNELKNTTTGFSLEGFLGKELINTNKNNTMQKSILSQLKDEFLSLFSKFETTEVETEVKLNETETEVKDQTETVVENKDEVVVNKEEELQNEINALKTLIEEMKKQMEEVKSQSENLSKINTELKAEVENLSKLPAGEIKTTTENVTLSKATVKKGQEAYNRLMELSKKIQ